MNLSFWSVGSVRGDEYYTLKEDADIIIDNIVSPPLKVWLPFNDLNSVWAGSLISRGFDVVITEGDFFDLLPPPGVQCIISNPPFSLKKKVLDRIKFFDLKFALILPFQWLNDSVPFDYGSQVMFFRQRMHFNTPEGILSNPRSNCFVLSNGLLKSDLSVIDKRKKS